MREIKPKLAVTANGPTITMRQSTTTHTRTGAFPAIIGREPINVQVLVGISNGQTVSLAHRLFVHCAIISQGALKYYESTQSAHREVEAPAIFDPVSLRIMAESTKDFLADQDFDFAKVVNGCVPKDTNFGIKIVPCMALGCELFEIFNAPYRKLLRSLARP
jgi:hypothetical protein